MSRKSSKHGATGQKSQCSLAQGVRHADNYGVEIVGFDMITEGILAGELVLLLEHLGSEIAADNYSAE